MTKLNLKGVDFRPEELDDAEVGEEYEPYDGPLAPRNTILAGYAKKMWVKKSDSGHLQVVNLFIADDNAGDKAVYNGMAIFDRVTFTPKAAFHYKPWLTAFGFKSVGAVAKADVSDDDENNGTPVNKIGKFRPGDDARCRVLIGVDRYEGEKRNVVGKWLPAEEADEPDDDKDDEPSF